VLARAGTIVRNTASSGIYAATLLERLGFGADSRKHVAVVNTGAAVMEYVAAHPGAVGLAQISEIRVLIAKGLPIRLAAPLPDEVQNVTTYEAAAMAGGQAEDAASALARSMGSTEAKAVFVASGID
jgi:hypothetical protein